MYFPCLPHCKQTVSLLKRFVVNVVICSNTDEKRLDSCCFLWECNGAVGFSGEIKVAFESVSTDFGFDSESVATDCKLLEV